MEEMNLIGRTGKMVRKHLNAPVFIVIILISALLYTVSCKKDEENIAASEPIVSTNAATLIGQGWAYFNGTVYAADKTCLISFEFDTTKSFRHSVKAEPDTVTGTETTTINAQITGLLPSTVYYYRALAAVNGDTIRGTETTFTTTTPVISASVFNPVLDYGSVSDREGNVYRTITIGATSWMAENLRSTLLNDGKPIEFASSATRWDDLATAGYCWYNNDSVSYGALYNWYAVETGKICPAGWHVPTSTEWTTLTDALGGLAVSGTKMKEAGTIHWTAGASGTNESGFTALPAGYRSYTGTYTNNRRYGFWWASDNSSANDAWCLSIFYGFNSAELSKSYKKSGFSVRCVKD